MIIRARDEADSIGRCLALLAAQSTRGEVEVIVVDNRSGDGTPEVARDRGATVIAFDVPEFSFGAALNAGAAAARGRGLVALSAHAFPRDERGLTRLSRALADPHVACASGDRYGPDGAPLTGRIEQDAALARAHPGWGYSNGAGAFRAEL